MESAGLAKAHRAAQDGGAGQMLFPGFEDDGLVERSVFPAIAFADEDAQQGGFVRELHGVKAERS